MFGLGFRYIWVLQPYLKLNLVSIYIYNRNHHPNCRTRERAKQCKVDRIGPSNSLAGSVSRKNFH